MLYAQGAHGDVSIFLIDGETSQHSILWRTELNILRLRQGDGDKDGKINKIWILNEMNV